MTARAIVLTWTPPLATPIRGTHTRRKLGVRQEGQGSQGQKVVWELYGRNVGSHNDPPAAPDDQTIVAGDGFGRFHFLQLVEADQTKPPIGETKIRLLRTKEQ
jgi:hypothetical protein